MSEVPEFYANGVLVHNCSRYLVNEQPDDQTPVPAAPVPTAQEAMWQRHRESWSESGRAKYRDPDWTGDVE